MKNLMKIISILLIISLIGCSHEKETKNIINLTEDGYSTKPVALIFKSETCSACIEQKPIWDKLKESTEYKDKVVFKEIDMQDPYSQDFIELFKISATPTIITLDKYSMITYMQSGLHNEEELKTILDNAILYVEKSNELDID